MSLMPRLGTELIPQLSQGEFNVDLRLAPGRAAGGDGPRDPGGPARDGRAWTSSTSTSRSRARATELDANPVDAGDHTGTAEHRAAARRRVASRKPQRWPPCAKSSHGIPGVQYEFTRPALMSFSSAAADRDPRATTSTVLRRVSRHRIEQAMEASDRFHDIKTTVERGNPEIQIVFDQERAAKLGLAVRDIADRSSRMSAASLRPATPGATRRLTCSSAASTRASRASRTVARLIVNPESGERPVTLEARR